MNFLQSILIVLISPIVSLLILLIFLEVIFSWLVAFNIMNLRNPIVAQIYNTVSALVRPILEPIRRLIPSFGGLDLSPIVALLLLQWVKVYVIPALVSAVG